MWSPYPKDDSTSWEKNYQFVLATSSLMALGGVAAFTITTIQLHASLSGAVKSLPALDPDLTVKWDGGFNGLVGDTSPGIRSSPQYEGADPHSSLRFLC